MAREMLKPAGELAVVGLSANKTVGGCAWSALCIPAARGVYYRCRLL